jgi:hypothetical protein
MPVILAAMRTAIARDLENETGRTAVAQLYERLPNLDFSRDLLAGAEADLRVLTVPRCGWTDLGTPRRVAEAIAQMPEPRFNGGGMEYAPWSLAAQRPPVCHAYA